jgi:AcrR family transcriptional regulator
LLQAAIDYIAGRGISDLSLRELASAIGTSHRMLIHHFGGREGLWTAVIGEVEQRQRDLLDELELSDDPRESAWQYWRHISDPSLWPNERLFFELYGQALQGRPGTEELLDGIVDAWIGPAVELLVARGIAREAAAPIARLNVAVTRGLLLDLLATGNREAVDAAMGAYIELLTR